jgi:hypothetical protein
MTATAEPADHPATTGDFVCVRRGCPHTFVVRSQEARMLVTFGPAGIEGFFTALGTRVTCSHEAPEPEAPDPELFARVADRYGMDVVGEPPTPPHC